MAFLDETGLAELWSLIQAEDATVEALANTKAKIATGSYKGTGTYGANNPVSITFDFAPKLVVIQGSTTASAKIPENSWVLMDCVGTSYERIHVPTTSSDSNAYSYVYTKKTADGKTLTWYHTKDASYGLNYSNMTYRFFAIG